MNDKKYVVGNLKISMDLKETSDYLKIINDKIDSEQVIICPTSIYAPYFLKHKYTVGLQNIHFEEDGPYTGEIAPSQAKSMGISCVIVGHSDRRNAFKESDTSTNKKILESLSQGLSVILCIGESLEEKELLKTDRVLKRQIVNALRYVKDLSGVMISYEPVWAVGTKKMPKEKDIEKTILYIKDVVKEKFNSDIKVIYGGSIDDKNIGKIIKIDDLDGVMVGTSACDAKKFLNIIEVVLKK